MTKRKSAPKAGRTLVTFLLDKSGSMQSIKDDTIGAFNAYLAGLRTEPTIDFNFLQFDSNSVDKLCANMPIADVPDLTPATFIPGASTPLIDASFNTIKAVEDALTRRDDAPKVVICIQTDGHENCSTEHSWDDLNALIKEKTALGWQFNFLGAGVDAYDHAGRMGISAFSTASYDHKSGAATRATFSAAAANTASYASGARADSNFTMGQRRGFGDKFAPASLGGTPPPRVTLTTSAPGVAKPRAATPIVDKITL